ncbi:MAG: type II toxin-antitoxin system HicB family antitoxin [Gemmataceae bacterium]|nr:type II toxin-antitoxin system HicB family antitoxin [Gemmataceae bacterium]
MLQYHAAYYKIEDGWFMAKVLDFPGVITQGKNLVIARRMLRDALREMALWNLEEGRPLPMPNPKATDRKASHFERVRLTVRVHSGAPA